MALLAGPTGALADSNGAPTLYRFLSRCKDRNFSVIFQLFSIYFCFHSKERFFSDFFVPNRDWPQRLSFRTFGKKTAFFFGDFMELAYL